MVKTASSAVLATIVSSRRGGTGLSGVPADAVVLFTDS
jgi:hypothetical protein